jgi:hypothetical protein
LSKDNLDKIQKRIITGGSVCGCVCSYFCQSNAILLACLILFGCRHGSQTVVNDLILLDAYGNLPSIELRLTDIADVSFIYLNPTKENLFLGVTSLQRNLFVYQGNIFAGDIYILSSSRLIKYDFNGEPLHVFGGERGRGPGEYLSLTTFLVDTLANEVILYSSESQKFVVWDLDGKFKREKFFDSNSFNASIFDAIENINEKYMLAYKSNSFEVNNSNETKIRGKLFKLFDKRTLEEVDFIDFEFAKPAKMYIWLFHHLTTTKEGIYISSYRTDTIYFMDRELNLFPRFVDITKYTG